MAANRTPIGMIRERIARRASLWSELPPHEILRFLGQASIVEPSPGDCNWTIEISAQEPELRDAITRAMDEATDLFPIAII